MILHTIIARGSLILAEFSESEDDYSNLIRKRLAEIKKSDEQQKLLKDGIYLYALIKDDMKFMILSEEEEDEKIFGLLNQIYTEQSKLDNPSTQILAQLLSKIISPKPLKQQEQAQIPIDQDDALLKQTPTPKRLKKTNSKSDFQKKICIGVAFLTIAVYVGLNYIIINE